MTGRQILTFLLFFVVYSFLGWAIECLYAFFRSGRLSNQGFLSGPHIPLYGFGSIFLIPIFQEVAGIRLESFVFYFVLFLSSSFILSLLEYLAGILLEKAYRIRWTDYRGYKCNLAGRFCLLRSFYLGCVGVLLIKLLHPMLIKVLSGRYGSVIQDWFSYVLIGIICCYVVDVMASTRLAKEFSKTMREWEDLAKERYQELGEKQVMYEKEFEEYEIKRLHYGQEWRQTVEKAKTEMMRDPKAGSEGYQQTLEKANEELRLALRRIKEDVAVAANERDRVMLAFQEDVRQGIWGRVDLNKNRRRYTGYSRLFKAFPEIAPLSATARRNKHDAEGSAMLTKEISVVSYVWQEAKKML